MTSRSPAPPDATMFPRPMVTVDGVVFGYAPAHGLHVLLVRREQAPARGRWALPGGFLHPDEGTEAALRRVLATKCGDVPAFLEQLYTFDGPNRDPRGWVITVAYFALLRLQEVVLRSDGGAPAAWVPVADAVQRPLAFDHAQILATALARLRAKVRYQPIGFELLPATFTLTDLQVLYEAILERPLDKRNFRKRLDRFDFVESTGQTRQEGAGRPALLYRFNSARYAKAQGAGILFEL